MSGTSSSNPIASAAKIHLLDLSALKERLGPKWERMAEHVQMFFEAAIRRSLMPGDTYCRFEELSYIVMFRKLSADEADLKCSVISEEVCRRLFGENGENVSLRNLVAHVGLKAAPTNAEQEAALNMLLERKGKEMVVAPQRGAKLGPHGSQAIKLRMVAGGKVLRSRNICLQDIAFLYRPVWDLTNQVVVTYLCQPTMPVSPSNAPAPQNFWAAEDEDEQVLLDLFILRECLERADRLRNEGLRLILAVPVNFATISRLRSWRSYSDMLSQVSEETRRNFAFVVFGIDRGVPHVRLAQELPKLSRMAYRVFCVAERNQNASARFARTGSNGIGIALDDADDELQSIARMRDVAKEAQAAGADSFVLGLGSTSLALMSIHSGVRYLEGPVVRPAVDDPRHGFAHEVEDLYKTKRVAT